MPFRFAIVVLAAVAIYGCKKQPSPTVFVDPALATLVPADTVFVAGIRVEQLHATPLWKRYIADRKLPAVEEFVRETGIDPRKDVWQVVIPYDGKTSWVMLRGKFAEMGMEPRIEREGAKRMGYKGYTMLGDEAMAVMFLNPTTAIASSFEALKRIVDNRDKGMGMPAWLQEKIRTIPSTNQIWFAGNPPVRTLGQFEPMILAGGVDLRSGVDAQITAESKSDQQAGRLRDAAKALVAKNWLHGGIRVEGEGPVVQVRVEIPEERLDELLRLLPSVSGQESRRQD